jgi:hypothetical protein
MKKLIGCLLLALPAFSFSAYAITDRSDVLKWCEGHSVAAAGRCIGFLLAAEDALSLGPVEGISACLPASVTLKEMYAAVLGWLPDHPEAQAKTGLGLVSQALSASYPCESK